MVEITVQEKYDNDNFFHHAEVAKAAIRNVFQLVQQGKGNWKSIRITRKFVECTIEGTVVAYTNRGNTIEVIERTYDTIVRLDGYMECYEKEIKWFRPAE